VDNDGLVDGQSLWRDGVDDEAKGIMEGCTDVIEKVKSDDDGVHDGREEFGDS
jgi:hypothetical protein